MKTLEEACESHAKVFRNWADRQLESSKIKNHRNDGMNAEEIRKIVAMEGDYKKFNYKGIECEIKRISWSGHLCGYLHIGGITDKEREIMDYNFHCGITYEHNGVYGFDCAHICDINPNHLHDDTYLLGYGATYKTMEYVENVLKETIDELKKEEE